MMVWTPAGQSIGGPVVNKLILGEYLAGFFTLTFNSTSVNGIAGQNYDPANHYTTTPNLSNVPGSNIQDYLPIKDVSDIILLEDSSSATARAAGGTTFTGVVRGVWLDALKCVLLSIVGCGNAGGATDPLSKNDETQLAANPGEMAPLSFRCIVIGR